MIVKIIDGDSQEYHSCTHVNVREFAKDVIVGKRLDGGPAVTPPGATVLADGTTVFKAGVQIELLTRQINGPVVRGIVLRLPEDGQVIYLMDTVGENRGTTFHQYHWPPLPKRQKPRLAQEARK